VVEVEDGVVDVPPAGLTITVPVIVGWMEQW
jgi:hypothetical protein